jgi:hypothetical protein
MPFTYSEADWLFNIFYRINSSLDFVVVDCAVYPQLNGLSGQLHSFKYQKYIAAVSTSKYSSPSCVSSVLMQLCPQYMEPLHKVTKFGIHTSSHQSNEEIVSLPNLLCGNEPTTQQIWIQFHWQVFEQTRERFIRTETTSNNLSSDGLCIELSTVDNQALVKNQLDIGDKLEYTTLYSNV